MMHLTDRELDIIRRQQEDFQELVQECNHEELGQCAKLLAMYVAVYKQQFGELPMDNLMEDSESALANQEISTIVQNGIEEASTMLQMVRNEERQQNHSFYYYPSEQSIN